MSKKKNNFMKRVTYKDVLILSELRKNARERLTRISKNTGIPVSTIFDRIRLHDGDLITRHTTLLNFQRLNFMTRANIILRVDKKERNELREYFIQHRSVNTAYKINNGFDFMIDVVFKNLKELEEFLDVLDNNYSIIEKQVYYIIEDLKVETFLSDKETVDEIIDG